MRTSKTIKTEADQAHEKFIEHANDCETCNVSDPSGSDEDGCSYGEFLYQEYECLMDEYNAAEETFQQELKERKLSIIKAM